MRLLTSLIYREFSGLWMTVRFACVVEMANEKTRPRWGLGAKKKDVLRALQVSIQADNLRSRYGILCVIGWLLSFSRYSHLLHCSCQCFVIFTFVARALSVFVYFLAVLDRSSY